MAEWYEAFDQPTRDHMQQKGWLEGDVAVVAHKAIQAHMGAEKFIGVPAGQIMKLPKSADDPAFAEAYNRIAELGVPKEYSFEGVKHKDGSEPKAEMLGSLKTLAAELKLPQSATARIAGWIVGQEDGSAESAAQNKQVRLSANEMALGRNWGDKKDYNSYLANKGMQVAGLPPETFENLKDQPVDVYLKTMDAFRVLGSRMEEAPYLGGGTSPNPSATGAMSREQAQAEKTRLMNDMEWGKKWVGGDKDARDLMDNLNRIIVMGPR